MNTLQLLAAASNQDMTAGSNSAGSVFN